jgi:hypothetical protein
MSGCVQKTPSGKQELRGYFFFSMGAAAGSDSSDKWQHPSF